MTLEASRVLRAVPATPVAESKNPPMHFWFSERVQSLFSPKELQSEDADDVMEFIKRGGRLQAIDYTRLTPEEKGRGFREAREYLHQPMHSVVAGVDIENPDRTYHHPNPNDPTEIFAPIHPLPRARVAEVMDIAMDLEFHQGWDGQENFTKRQDTIDQFVAHVYQERSTLAALMALCQGKTGFEVYRDMQELFDFWREYREVREPERYNEFLLRSNGDTTLEYRPLDGVVGIWQPFNFSCIGAGDTMGALLMGNAVVVHTSARNVGTYKWLYDQLLEAGVPPERVQFVIPHDDPDPTKVDPSMSEALAEHPGMQLIQFTGSHAVAQKLHAIQAKKVQEGVGRLDYKLQAEASGYNPFLITGLPAGAMQILSFQDSLETPEDWEGLLARIEKEGGVLHNLLHAAVDSVTGLQAHKCSSCKEFVVALDVRGDGNGVHPVHAGMLKLLITERLKRVKVGSVEGGGVEMGALIDRKMHGLVRANLQKIVQEGGVPLTAATVEEAMETHRGLSMTPVLYEVLNGDNLDTMDKVEIFAPVVRWNEVEGIDAALERANDLGYALTATVVAPTEAEAKALRSAMPQGVIYISSDDGKIDGCTGAPAPQIPFGGSGKSGTGSAYRPGNSRSPLSFTQEVSFPRKSRAHWGKGLHPSPTSDVLDSIARRDPEGVMAWVRKEIAMRVESPMQSAQRVDCYREDGRRSLAELYRSYMRLAEEYGWEMEGLYSQTWEGIGGENVPIPVLSFRTQAKGPALWVLSGIHGEEPAGPNAFAENIEIFAELGRQGVPMVVVPLCNPKGYSLNWRFPNTADRKYASAENPKGGVSVGDSDHLLPDKMDPSRPLRMEPVSKDAQGLTDGVVRLCGTHPPRLVLDHHEDELVPGCYLYVQRTGKADDPLAREVLAAMEGAGIPLNRQDRTRFGEPIINGVVAYDEGGDPIHDGSVDDLLSSLRIFVDGGWRPGPSAPHTFVVETPAQGPLPARARTHTAVFRALPRLWEMAQESGRIS